MWDGVDSGTMELLGRPWKPRSPWDALQAGLVYLPEERKRHGLVADHGLSPSLAIGILWCVGTFVLMTSLGWCIHFPDYQGEIGSFTPPI